MRRVVQFLVCRNAGRSAFRSGAVRGYCSEPEEADAEAPFDKPAETPPVAISRIPRVVFAIGDAFVEDSFAKVATEPRWLGEAVLPRVETWYMEQATFDRLSCWRPLSSTVHYLSSTLGLKVQGWSRHPTNTSLMVYSLLNDFDSREQPSTVVPHYHIDRLRKLWQDGNEPFYYKDVQGHSATYRASCDYIGQEPVYMEEYPSDAPPPPPVVKDDADLPEMFAVVGGLDGDWSNITTNPPTALEKHIAEARRECERQSKNPEWALAGAPPLLCLINHLYVRYGVRMHQQLVTNNDLTKITFYMEYPYATKRLPRTPREGRVSSHEHEGPFSGVMLGKKKNCTPHDLPPASVMEARRA
eukprot:Sspe_Gene.99107::Locus_72506_Transcript_1_1_Confidence_1.000_Length_1272::g.99107::m.99107